MTVLSDKSHITEHIKIPVADFHGLKVFLGRREKTLLKPRTSTNLILSALVILFICLIWFTHMWYSFQTCSEGDIEMKRVLHIAYVTWFSGVHTN